MSQQSLSQATSKFGQSNSPDLNNASPGFLQSNSFWSLPAAAITLDPLALAISILAHLQGNIPENLQPKQMKMFETDG